MNRMKRAEKPTTPSFPNCENKASMLRYAKSRQFFNRLSKLYATRIAANELEMTNKKAVPAADSAEGQLFQLIAKPFFVKPHFQAPE